MELSYYDLQYDQEINLGELSTDLVFLLRLVSLISSADSCIPESPLNLFAATINNCLNKIKEAKISTGIYCKLIANPEYGGSQDLLLVRV